MFHQDIYGSGYDHSDSDGIVLRTQLTPVIDKYDIDAVLQGHDHTYSRTYQLTSDGNTNHGEYTKAPKTDDKENFTAYINDKDVYKRQLCKTAAPMIPFMTESIYRNLVCSIDKTAPISIHLCDFPEVKEEWIDKELEDNMEDVLNAVVIGRACRNSTNIKNRQPIGKLYIKADWKLNEYFTAIIADELNVKEVEYTDDVRAFTSYSFKPQLKTLGPKYGKHLNAIRAALSTLDGNATMDELNTKGSFTINADGEDIVLEKDDVLIEMTQKEGFVASSDKGITVVMDTNLTPELIEEGFVREIVSKIQTMRKDAGFEVMDKITVYVDGNDKLADLMVKNAEQIKSCLLYTSRMKNIKEIGDFFINLNEYVYATDIETNEIVYMNHKALKAYGLESIEDIKGKKCYEVLQKASVKCGMCNNSRLLPGAFEEWRYYNPVLDKYMIIKDTLIEGEGNRKYRLEIGIEDVYKRQSYSCALYTI